MLALVLATLGCSTVSLDDKPSDTGECTLESAGEVYERYVEPVMSDAHPQSCNQCHLSGVDLTMYLQDTPCQTMACMVDIGLVDLADPEASRILEFIAMAEPESDLITEDVVQREYDGFLAWIEYSAQCHDDACGEIEDPCLSGTDDNTLPEGIQTPLGGCDETAIVDLFYNKIYHWSGRCLTCHYKGGEAAEDYDTAPRFWDVHRDSETDSIAAAGRTMYNLIGLGDVDTDNPLQSLLLTKPLREELGGVYHDGGPKIHDLEEQTYIDFALWLETYATCYNEGTSAQE